jgi:hypothetical protein
MSEFEQLIEAMLQQCVELRKRHPDMSFNVWVPKFGEASILFRKYKLSWFNRTSASIGVKRGGSVDECIKAIDDFIAHEMAA